MAGPTKETVVKFRADTSDYKKSISDINRENRALNQELKLTQSQMKLTGSEVDKHSATLSTLGKQYELAQKKTRETAEQLQRAKQVWGENSTEVRKAEEALRKAQLAESEMANKIQLTTQALNRAQQAEAERNSEVGKSKQKLDELKNAESQLQTEIKKVESALEQEKVALGDSLSASEKLQMQQRHLGEQLELSSRSVKNLEQQLQHAKTAYGANSTEANQLETRLNEVRTAEMRLKNEVEQASTSLREQANVADKTAQKLSEIGNKTKEIGEGLSSTVTPALAGVMGVTGKWANDFDTSTKQIQASLGLTAEGAKNVGKVAEDVFLHGWGENLREVDNAVMRVWQNMKDVPLDQLQNVTEGVMALSKTFEVDLNETTRGASALMTQYGMDGAQSLDLITAGLQAGLDKSGEFTDNLAEYTPLFKQAGFTSNEMMNILKNGLDAGA